MDPNDGRVPLFLLAAERSGTTLLRLMLDGHSQIAWPCEFDFALDWPPARASEWPASDEFARQLREDRQALQAGVAIDESLSFPELVRSLLAQLRQRSNKPFLGVTAHRGYDRILRLWPNARFIYLVRDGRAVARSAVEMGWAGNEWAGSFAWRDAERAWRRLARVDPSRAMELRYEDLVRDPVGELGRVCVFIGVEYESGMLDYPKTSTYAAPNPAIVDAWRDKLSARGMALIESEIGAELRERNYPLDLTAATSIGPLRRISLRVDDRVRRARFAIRIYGWRLWFARFASRVIGSTSWRKSVGSRIRGIDTSRLR